MSLSPYSAAEFRRRAASQMLTLGEESWRDHGDSLLNPGVIPHLEDMKLRDAAVLIPVVDDGAEARVIFTQRTATMRKHSGQVAFPGGAVDAEDGDAETDQGFRVGGGGGHGACVRQPSRGGGGHSSPESDGDGAPRYTAGRP